MFNSNTVINIKDCQIIKIIVDGSSAGIDPISVDTHAQRDSRAKVIEKTLLDMAAKEDEAVAEDSGALQEPEQDSKDLVERAESATLQLKDFMTRAQEVSLSVASKITEFAMIPSFLIPLVIAVIAFLPVLLVNI